MSDSPFKDGEGPVTPPASTKPKNRKPQKVVAAKKAPAAKPAGTALSSAAASLPSRQPMSGVALRTPEPEPENLPVSRSSVLPDGRARVPFGQQALKLDYEQREGYQRRWINDTPGRIRRAMQGGWVHVEENGKPVDYGVSSGGLKAFLMEIPNEFYDEDFEQKQEKLNEVDDQVYRGTHKQEAGDKRYVPPGAIKVGVQRGR